MTDASTNVGTPSASAAGTPATPAVVDRADFQTELDALRVREKSHTREGDAIAAARRRLPMVEVDPNLELIGPNGPLTLLQAFEGRRQLIAYSTSLSGAHGDPDGGGLRSAAARSAESAFLASKTAAHRDSQSELP